VIYATSVLDSSMTSGACSHTYHYSIGLSGPNSTHGNADLFRHHDRADNISVFCDPE